MTPRRRFLKQSGGALAGLAAFPNLILRAAAAPSEQITVGFIGTGSHGIGRNLNMFLQQADARVLAVCDPYRDRMEKAKGMTDERYGNNDCEMVSDFRKIIARDDIDAVMISTPDHWHTLISDLALRSGKDVICEKPTLTIAEGRYLSDLVASTGRVFQTATEDRSYFNYHRMAELVRNGRIGKLERVEVRLPRGDDFPDENPAPVPAGFDYDMWLGPAPEAPFTASRTKPMHWRQIWDYSGGLLTDWGMHQLDTVQLANDTEATGPISVGGHGTLTPGSMFNTFVDYDLTYAYANGVQLHVQSGGTSLRFIGSDGWVGNAGWDAGLEASDRDILHSKIGDDETKLFREPAGEHRNFLDCVKTRNQPYFPAEFGHRCATLCHMGNIAMQLERDLAWDPEAESFPDDEEANALRSRPMRAPWKLGMAL
ncbi:Gfo/Idh/MocA family oxidoreductase [soil metagenome]